MKKLLLVVLAVLVLCLPGTALADEAYTITDYDVHIKVSESNVLDVEERLNVNFTQERHGIFYNLQVQGTGYYYMNGQSVPVRYNQHVQDFNVQNVPFELSREDEFLVARIGDADRYVQGEQEYVITYKADAGDNRYDEFDDFYRNIINCASGDIIEQANFVIELPKDFDESFVKVTMGPYGSEDTSGVAWEREGNTIKGHTLRPLTGGERVTVRMEFPDDYFTENVSHAFDTIIYIVSGVLVLLALVLWLAFGRDGRLFPTVEFYAPDGMTPAEVGYVVDGVVDDKDVVALILYWADKGYLKIVERKKKDFELVKLKNLDKGKAFERTMFNKLFTNGDAVALSSLKNSFYVTMSAVKTGVKNYFDGSNERRLFTKASKRASGFMAVLTMLPIAITIYHFVYADVYESILALIAAALVGLVIALPAIWLARVIEKWHSTKKGIRMAKLLVSAILLGLVLLLYVVLVPSVFYVRNAVPIVVTAAATLVMLMFAIIMKKRTKQSAEWLAKLIGFKNFIDKAEKDRIQLLVEENPSYFYNVLPYAYVMGVTDKWAKNFEGIGVEPPDWYSGHYGSSMFNTILFTSMISRNMSQFQNTFVSRPEPSGTAGSGGFSGGGGFGGGGFSGGGFGGGGAGGSW